MEIKFKVWFPKAKRIIRFKGMSFCGEYETLSFAIEGDDCTEKYQHLGGESFIPNEKGEIIEIKIK